MEPSETESEEPLVTKAERTAPKIASTAYKIISTGIVIFLAAYIGVQLISAYRLDKYQDPPTVAEVLDAWPTLQSCSLEFGDSPFRLQRETAFGSESDVMEHLSIACKDALQRGADPVKPVGEAEAKMIESLQNEVPFLSSDDSEASGSGDRKKNLWRIFHVARIPGTGQFPQVVGIRDDCDVGPPPEFEQDESQTDQQWPAQRLVVWGIAIPNGDEKWTTYIGRASLNASQFGIATSLIPSDAKRTLAISDKQRASVIGFSGSTPESAKSFYDELSDKLGWKLVSQWQHHANNWTAKYTSDTDSSVAGIQVQLHVNHNQPMRGLVTLTPSMHHGSEPGKALE